MEERHYILAGHEPKAVDLQTFARWWGEHPGPKRAVAQETLPDGRWLSTVFLGFDHSLTGTGPPVLFETMLFKSEDDLTESYRRRYATWDAAEAGHRRVKARVLEGRDPDEAEDEDEDDDA